MRNNKAVGIILTPILLLAVGTIIFIICPLRGLFYQLYHLFYIYNIRHLSQISNDATLINAYSRDATVFMLIMTILVCVAVLLGIVCGCTKLSDYIHKRKSKNPNN